MPTDKYDSASFFWPHERLHRATLLNYPKRVRIYESARDELEQKFVEGALALKESSPFERARWSAGCFREASLA
ncbi:MAG: hypothetical protein N2049_04020 [Anaerolineales bacterium]|nr:hypothetical protein [Anaerolineales bacterium]